MGPKVNILAFRLSLGILLFSSFSRPSLELSFWFSLTPHLKSMEVQLHMPILCESHLAVKEPPKLHLGLVEVHRFKKAIL